MSKSSCDILIAEDDDQISYLLEFLIAREGYKVKVANNGLEAKDYLSDIKPPKLILLDIIMPYFDGYQLISYIRNDLQWKNVPIVVLTSKSQEKDIVRALELGANDCIMKPFQPGELIARLKLQLKHAA